MKNKVQGVKERNYWKKIENQREYIDKLFHKLQIKSFEGWHNQKASVLQYNGGQSIVKFYKGNMEKLLKSIYPHYPWDFDSKQQKNRVYFKVKENRVKFMDRLYKTLKCKSLEEFQSLMASEIELKEPQAYRYLLSYYQNNISLLFTSIYPFYPWNLRKFFSFSFLLKNIDLIEYQRFFMQILFEKFQLRDIDDWKLISKRKMIRHHGLKLLQLYQFDLKLLLTTLYPHQDFKFNSNESSSDWTIPKGYFRSIDNQRSYMQTLFRKLNLKELNDWLKLSKYRFMKSHPSSSTLLRKYYQDNYQLLLQSIFPDHNWDFSRLKSTNFTPKYYWRKKENQRNFMEKLYIDLQLKSLDDWLKISKRQIILSGGKYLLAYYRNDFPFLLTSLYPNHDWQFEEFIKINPNLCHLKSFHFNRKKLLEIQNLFSIERKEDWYRVPILFNDLNLYHSLQTVHPDHFWNKSIFYSKSKRSKQRLLFTSIKSIFQSSSPLFQNHSFPSSSSLSFLSSPPSSSSSSPPSSSSSSSSFSSFSSSPSSSSPPSSSSFSSFSSSPSSSSTSPSSSSFSSSLYTYLILENYRHPIIFHEKHAPYEFDIFIPSLSLAIEYQGEQHYDDHYIFPLESNQLRDVDKQQIAKLNSISLICVPFWWDFSHSSLLSSLFSSLYSSSNSFQSIP